MPQANPGKLLGERTVRGSVMPEHPGGHPLCLIGDNPIVAFRLRGDGSGQQEAQSRLVHPRTVERELPDASHHRPRLPAP